MGVNFYIANKVSHISISQENVRFEEELQCFLLTTKERTMPSSTLLLYLDPYGDRLFTKNEFEQIINICYLLKKKYKENDVIDFADSLLDLCKLAIEREKSILALGD